MNPAPFSRRLIASIWALVGVLAAYVAVSLWQAHRTIEANVSRQALSFARLVAQHAAATVDRTNITLLDIVEHLNVDDLRHSRQLAPARRAALQARMIEHQKRADGIVSISLTDADGIVFANTVGMAPGTSLADRRYFLAVKAGPRDTPVISEAIKGRVSGKWGIQIARRIELPDGSFGGMVVANLGLAENFERFYETIDLGPHSLITLRDSDNRILVRHPSAEQVLGTVVTGSAGALAIQEGHEESVVNSRSPIDGRVRITAARRVPDTPVFAVVGIDRETTFREWHRELAAGIILMAIMALGGLFIVTTLRSRDELTQDLAAAKEAAEAADRTKSRFLAAASHDLRQPVHAIDLFVHSLSGTGLSAEQEAICRRLALSAGSLRDVLNALLDISRIDSGFVESHATEIDAEELLHPLIEEMDSLATDKRLRFKLHCPPGVALFTDAALLRAILRNIIDNAIKYTERGGVLVGVRRRIGYALIQVWDTGCGIAPEHQDEVFDEFFQIGNPERDRAKGLGLGLAIVRRLARLIDSDVCCRSRPGRGTMFEVMVPLADAGWRDAGITS